MTKGVVWQANIAVDIQRPIYPQHPPNPVQLAPRIFGVSAGYDALLHFLLVLALRISIVEPVDSAAEMMALKLLLTLWSPVYKSRHVSSTGLLPSTPNIGELDARIGDG
jgi:hypothetical protein